MINLSNSSTQNAHILKHNLSMIAHWYETHRDNKAYERFKHVPDYGTTQRSREA
jgi:hypothetical protein